MLYLLFLGVLSPYILEFLAFCILDGHCNVIKLFIQGFLVLLFASSLKRERGQ